MEEAEGFEPSVDFRLRILSKDEPSAARSRFQKFDGQGGITEKYLLR